MTDKNKQQDGKPSGSVPCSSEYRKSLIKSIKVAHKEALEKLDYAAIAKFTGKDEAGLEAEAKESLGRLLNNYPNTTSTMGGGWHIRLIRQGHGTHLVEMSYPVTWSTGLIFNIEKINEAAEHGLIDENGEPVFDPPCCPSCLRKNVQSQQPITKTP